MPPTVQIQFADRLVTYETFMTDLTARLSRVIKSDAADPEYVSQRTAYSVFGRKNVDRWRRTGKVKPSKRPGKVEYRITDLRLPQRTQQFLRPDQIVHQWEIKTAKGYEAAQVADSAHRERHKTLSGRFDSCLSHQ